ncbi:unnamed protein product, partial [Mesorhabditis belari]|uniref:Uncharacterized protein n=1 Tax=Mesorhabditis belari TaxID=2138241 RepID=A0AAF3FHD8_9BILA
MGCNVSSNGQFEPEKYDSIWSALPSVQTPMDGKRKNSKIMRLNIVSTFKDFRNERVAIHDLLEDREIVMAARAKGVIIQLEDFNAGQKASLDDPHSIYALTHCLLESQLDNGNPYYIHLFGEVLGYVIRPDFNDQEFLNRFGLRKGLALSEASLVLSRLNNPNGIYFRRDASFLREIPFHEPVFIDETTSRDRANYLADSVQRKVNNYHIYQCTTEGINNTYNKAVIMKGLESLKQTVKEFILSHLATDFSARTSNENENGKNEKRKRKHSKLNDEHETAILKVMAAVETHDVILIHGDYGSGKSAVLAKLAKDRSIPLFFGQSGKDLKNQINEENKEICIDDIDVLSKDEILAISSDFVKKNGKLFATSRKIPRALVKNNGELKLFTIQLANSENQDHIKNILCQYLTFVSPQEENESMMSRTFDSETIRIAETIMERTSARDENEMEEGLSARSDSGGWSTEKATILGSMVRFGAKPTTARELIKYSTASICEADLHLMEAEMRGHLLIGSLCILTIASDGIEERQLRRLLAPEDQLLPVSFKRKGRGLIYDFCDDRYGKREEVLALRWRYVRMRIGYYLQMVDLDRHALSISPVCKKVVQKRYLSNEQTLEHFQRMMQRK